jgi:O-antigen ligase
VERATGGRSEAWRATLRFVRSKPLLGYGFGTGDRIFGLYPSRVHFIWYEGSDPASAYLRLLLELGVLGLVVLVPLLGAAVLGVRLLVSGRSLEGSSCALVLLAGLAVGLVESIFTTAGAPWAPLLWAAAAGCYASWRAA